MMVVEISGSAITVTDSYATGRSTPNSDVN